MVLAIGAGSAEARRSHRHGWGHISRNLVVPPSAYREQSLSRRSAMRSYARRSGRVYPQEFPPPDWQLQAPDPNWTGRRYLSPAGDAWIAFYTSLVAQDSFAERLKAVAFADGEEVQNLTADRKEFLVTGTKADRVFVRQARLACSDRHWHHIAMEFPISMQRDYSMLVAQAARVLAMADNDGCDAPTAQNER
jgi:hypothetical protein